MDCDIIDALSGRTISYRCILVIPTNTTRSTKKQIVSFCSDKLLQSYQTFVIRKRKKEIISNRD